jgi:hypothetical protein
LILFGDALALVALVDAMAVGRGRESRHDAASASFMMMSGWYGGYDED